MLFRSPAWIGITVQDMDAELAKYLNVSNIKGVLVKKTEVSGPAFKSGIREGDIIQSIGSRKIFSQNDFNIEMGNISAGETLKISVLRDGKTKMFHVRSAAFPEALALELAYDILGIKVKNLSKNDRNIFKIYAKEGVMISDLNSNSYLARIGAEPGDVIRQLNEFTVKNTKDFKKAIIKYRKRKSLVIVLQRKDQIYNISVRL